MLAERVSSRSCWARSSLAPARAATEIQWWHAMAGELGRQLEQLAADFNATAERLQDRPGLQGPVHRDDDGGAVRDPHRPAARDRAGQRGRDRHHDGGEGRDLSGPPADERAGRGFRSGRLSAGGVGLLHRRRRQHAVVSVQRLDADPLLQQGPVPRRRARSRSAAANLAGGRGRGAEAARGRRAVRLHHRMAVLGPHREPVGRITTCRSPRSRTASAGSTPSWSINNDVVVRHITALAEWQKSEDLRLWRARRPRRAEILRQPMRHVHLLLGHARRRSWPMPSSRSATA